MRLQVRTLRFTGGGYPPSRTGPCSTPTVDGEQVYTLGATGILLCLEAKTGKLVWRQELLKLGDCKVSSHGYCGSPFIVGERLFVQTGGRNGRSIAALDKRDGKVLWQTLDEPLGQATPLWADVAGTGQVVFFTGAAAIGVTPNEGKMLWRYPWKTQYGLNIATPIYTDGKVFVSSNYGTGAALFRLTDKPEPETIWKALSMQNHFSCSVLHEGVLYGFSEQRLRCVDFATGKVALGQDRLQPRLARAGRWPADPPGRARRTGAGEGESRRIRGTQSLPDPG